ncbi:MULTISPECIES: lipocalin family protein [unclassified Acinetobacter]|uniref:lipocalin family protein n=1 Tax=unclassified Acinetobacter TaxID=196816 RepID=UPI002934BB58|nr:MULTISPECIES: lipocalin family protein [unclassified Acinetobacter]WOE31641.1 lipocalin family protein [Acinetobacter sp. SAAs470]WOE37106.1 lipocalin family protein [Acinetobacter sp. SAAs474]
MNTENLPKAGIKLAKILLGSAVLVGLGAVTLAYAQTKPLNTVIQVDLNRYLGTWYEIARKPLSFQNKCDRNVSAQYSLNEQGNIRVDNRCYGKDNQLYQSIGEAYVQNPPDNSQLKVSFLPQAIRWLPVGRGDYWILKLDDDYQTVLVGEPRRKYMWILSRTPQLEQSRLQQYLDYAKSVGYNLDDVIYTQHTQK